MEFTWKDRKAKSNFRKHGVTFETAATVWNDPRHRIEFDSDYEGEERWFILGMDFSGQLLAVIHIELDETIPLIHIISARKAVAYEEDLYRTREI